MEYYTSVKTTCIIHVSYLFDLCIIMNDEYLNKENKS